MGVDSLLLRPDQINGVVSLNETKRNCTNFFGIQIAIVRIGD